MATPQPRPAPDPVPDPTVRAVLDELSSLRARMPGLAGSLVASIDGLLVAHDLPPGLEPHGLAALTASQLGLSQRLAAAGGGGVFREVVVRGDGGHVVIYSAGRTASLTVLAGSAANVGRLHLESRPVARAIAEHLAAPRGPVHHPERKDAP